MESKLKTIGEKKRNNLLQPQKLWGTLARNHHPVRANGVFHPSFGCFGLSPKDDSFLEEAQPPAIPTTKTCCQFIVSNHSFFQQNKKVIQETKSSPSWEPDWLGTQKILHQSTASLCLPPPRIFVALTTYANWRTFKTTNELHSGKTRVEQFGAKNDLTERDCWSVFLKLCWNNLEEPDIAECPSSHYPCFVKNVWVCLKPRLWLCSLYSFKFYF